MGIIIGIGKEVEIKTGKKKFLFKSKKFQVKISRLIILFFFLSIGLFFILAQSPTINFTSPTPANATIQSATNSVKINVSITDASDLAEVIFNWNSTNYTIYDDSLVLMMNFDNVSTLGESDTYVVDMSKYGNNGTVSGAVVNTTGKYGGAFEFDGVNDNINVPNDPSLGITANFSLAAWINPSSLTATGQIITKRDTSSPFQGYEFISINSGGNYYIRARSISTSSQCSTNPVGKTLTVGVWKYVVIVYDGSQLKVFEDGTEQTDKTISCSVNPDSNTQSLKVGEAFSLPFNGTIDEVRVWNRSLTNSEVQQLYFTNLNKYDTDKWSLYVNQSKNSTDGLDNGIYTYQAFAANTSSNWRQTEERTITIELNIPPVINNYSLNYTNYWVKQNGKNLFIDITNCTDPNDDSITYNWTVDGVLASSLRNITFNASDYSVGTHNVTGYCYDDESASDSQNFNIEIIGERDFLVVALPDTQFYTETYPAYFDKQTEWIAEIHNQVNITFVMHLGDMVEQGDNITHFDNANSSMSKLDDTNVPYGTAIGIHDYDNRLETDKNATNWNTYFNESRYDNYSWFGDSKDNNGENTYFLFNVSDMGFLVLFLEFCPTNSTVEWANTTINNYPDRRVMIATHLYMFSDDTRHTTGDAWHCENYVGLGSDWNDGDDMWEKLANFNKNVFFITNGHVVNDGTGYRNDTGVNGNVVHQILSNYQGLPNGGDSWLRIYRFSSKDDIIYAKTYTPYLDQFNTSSDQTFNMGYDMDIEYPIFSNYWDNDRGLLDNGTALFNVTLLSTNGTVFLEINNTNYTATNLTASVYNVSVSFTSSGAYSYYWGSWSNGTDNNYNTSAVRSYTVNSTDTTPPNINFTSPTPSNATTQSETNIEINVSIITNATDLSEVIFNWNSTNYTIYDDSLVLMMNFDNVSSLGENDTYVVDMSKYGNNGTVSGNPVMNIGGGKYFGGIDLDGAGDYFTTSTTGFYTDAGTISTWVKFNSLYNFEWIYAEQGTGNNNNEIEFYVDSTNSLIFRIWGGATGTVRTASMTAGVWTYIVGTWNSSDVCLYMNGGNQNCTTTNALPTAIASTAYYGTRAQTDFWMNGSIDEVRIWNRSLSDSEIQQLYFTNLQKYNQTQWYLYVNQSKNSTDGLDEATYTYQAFARDTLNNLNSTDLRSITISEITDTCSPTSPLTGNYQFECSDNCIQSTVLESTGFDITFNGSGTFTASSNINNIGNWFVRAGCQVIINSGVRFGIWVTFIK